jgi:hypothetical protein
MRKSTIRNQHKVIRELIAKNFNVCEACSSAKIGRTQFYAWLKTDENFCNAINNAMNIHLGIVQNLHLLKVFQNGTVPDTQNLLSQVGIQMKRFKKLHNHLINNILN